MNASRETGTGVPAFLAKLWRLVEDPETNDLICWNKDGRSFFIQNQAQFAHDLLPLNYKHNNMASFIRQLNMYGFHKITSIDNGGLKFDRDEMEFSHPCFKRGCPYLLEDIKRKISNTKTIDEKATVKPEAVYKVLTDVKAMRGRQDSMDSRFSSLKHENEALWREVATVRQKVGKQQQIINKLVQFLITIVQPSRNMTSVKRHMQLMINDTPEGAKIRQTSESESECGPVIHELREELFDEVNNDDSDLDDPSSPYVDIPSVESNRPENERPPSTLDRFHEDNHLTTPMVNEHNQMLKSKNQQNKRKSASSTVTTSSTSPATKMFRTAEKPVHIKTEPKDIDTLMFLDGTYATNRAAEAGPSSSNMNLTTSITPRLQSPYLSLLPSQINESLPTVATNNDSVMYNTGDFIVSDMPSELFDESPIISDTNLVSGVASKQKSSPSVRQLQLQSVGKVSDYDNGGSSPKNFNLQLAKVNNTNKCVAEATRDEVSSNIDGVQDELGTLKDLLRGDGYSLDANTLLGLFNDSDILGPYGLLMAQENLQNHKGSELMTFHQPMYDLNDIMDINDENNENNSNSNSSKQYAVTDSNLNTPYHESSFNMNPDS